MAHTEPQHLLSGYTVLDFTQVLAGPTVTRLMAEMGAEIIKVEMMPNGEISRSLPFMKEGRSAYFIQQNRGKKSLCIDPRHPKGQEILKELIKKVDVPVENFSPGTIARLGFGYDVVKELNPRIIMCSISALGQTGPLSAVPGYDYIGQAYAGVTYMIGDPDGAPSFPMLGIGDVSTGVHAYAAIASALLYRERTGKGQYLDIALLDAYFHCHELNVQLYSGTGGAVQPKRSGSHHYAISPAGLFKGKDTYLFILCLEHQWAVLCRAMGKPELIADPRFVTNAKRVEHQVEMISILKAGSPRRRAMTRQFVFCKRAMCRSRRCCRLLKPSIIPISASEARSARLPTARLASSTFLACRSGSQNFRMICPSKLLFSANTMKRFSRRICPTPPSRSVSCRTKEY